VDRITTFGAALAWDMTEYTQVGFDANYQRRQSASLLRNDYDGVIAGAFIRYGL
jgi:hypothetical protein